jgi:hypothetical protein
LKLPHPVSPSISMGLATTPGYQLPVAHRLAAIPMITLQSGIAIA